MFEETLFGNAKENLAILGESKILEKAYLAGGTAAALQLGHRGIKIANLRDIAAMKIDAIATRGYKRDFIDLYFISKDIPLQDSLKHYNRKYGKLASNVVHIQKSLVYFQDAEIEEMPRMLIKVEWAEVKRFFEKEVKKITAKIIK